MKKILLSILALLMSARAGAYTVNGNLNVWGGNVSVYSDAGSTLKWKIDKSTGNFGFVSGAKFYLNGTGLSGSGSLTFASSAIQTDVNFAIPSGNHLGLDGGTNTVYLQNSSGIIVSNGSMGILSGAHLTLDGSTNNTYFQEVSSGIPVGIAGGTEYFRGKSSGEILFPAVDPPTANYANRNSVVKGWADISSGGSVNASYNVSSVSHGATGVYTINWNTDFSSANYAVVVTPASALISSVTKTAGASTVSIVNTSSTLTNEAFNIIAIGTQ